MPHGRLVTAPIFLVGRSITLELGRLTCVELGLTNFDADGVNRGQMKLLLATLPERCAHFVGFTVLISIVHHDFPLLFGAFELTFLFNLQKFTFKLYKSRIRAK